MNKPTKSRQPQIRPKRHGGYSLIVTGASLQHRAYLLSYLTEAREGLVRDLGGEEAMSMAQFIIVDRAISKLGIVRCIEEHSKENGVFQGQNLVPSLGAYYLAYSNSIRLDLQALGIEKKMADRVLTPLEIAAEFDKEEEAKK